MEDDQKTEYSPIQCPNLALKRSLGRCKLTYYESLIDQNGDKRTVFPRTRNHGLAHNKTGERFITQLNGFLISQKTSEQKNHPSTCIASNKNFENF